MNTDSRAFISACVLGAECREHMSCADCPLYFGRGESERLCALGHGGVPMSETKIRESLYGTLMKNLSAVRDGAVRGALVEFLAHCASVDDCARCMFSARSGGDGPLCMYDDTAPDTAWGELMRREWRDHLFDGLKDA